MLNCIKMDLFRMFHSKKLYVIWIFLAVLIAFTTVMAKIDYNMIKEEIEKNKDIELNEVNLNENNQDEVLAGKSQDIGVSVVVPMIDGEHITVYDLFFSNLNGRVIALLMVIFAVLFSLEDMSSGYIKNIGGQIKDRGKLIVSKATVLFVYTILTMVVYLIVQTVLNAVFFDKLYMGPIDDLIKYSLVQTLLHYALLLICMAVSIVLRSTVFSIVFALLLSMNFFVIVYSTIDKAVKQFGIDNFQTFNHTVMGRIALLSMSPGNKEIMTAIAVSIIFGAAAVFISYIIFKKRDI